MVKAPRLVSIRNILSMYDCILLDAYGVLVNSGAVLPFACDFIKHLNSSSKVYYILSNGSRAAPSLTAEKYQSLGLAIAADQVITSGSLSSNWLNERNSKAGDFNKVSIVGPKDSHFILNDTNCELIELNSNEAIDGIIITNQDGFPFVETVNILLSKLIKAKEKGIDIPILLPNPDIIYPEKNSCFAITSGSIAILLEQAFELRFPGEKLSIHKIGKPYPYIFDQVCHKLDREKCVMIGDQIATDIAGANNSGIDSALINTGINSIYCEKTLKKESPTYLLKDLNLKG